MANTGNPVTYETDNLVGDPNLSNPTCQAWFNKSVFQIPAVYTFGNPGRDIIEKRDLDNSPVTSRTASNFGQSDQHGEYTANAAIRDDIYLVIT